MTWLSRFATAATQRAHKRVADENAGLKSQVALQKAAVEALMQERDHANAAAQELLRKLSRRDVRIEELEHDRRLWHQHLTRCETAQAIEQEDAAKRRSDV